LQLSFGNHNLTYVFGKVDVEVDTTSRKAYWHTSLISQEQPHSMRILVSLILKATLMVSFESWSPTFTWWLIDGYSKAWYWYP
jgi:hypothetical protein